MTQSARELRISEQVIEFIKRFAPELRRAAKRSLADLRQGKGDIIPLENNLAGYHRLRVGRHRIIFVYTKDGDIDVLFMAERRLVYEIFEAEFIKRLKSKAERPD